MIGQKIPKRDKMPPACRLSRMARLHLIRSVRSSLPAGAASAGPAATPAPGPPRVMLPRRWDAPRAVRLAAAVGGLAAILTYLVVALGRLGYPFPLEYLE